MERDAQAVRPKARQRSLIDHFGAPAHVNILEQLIARRSADLIGLVEPERPLL